MAVIAETTMTQYLPGSPATILCAYFRLDLKRHTQYNTEDNNMHMNFAP
jgi:hypothetical protein